MTFNNRILIVDDNPSIHADFKKILEGNEQNGTANAFNLFMGTEPSANSLLNYELTSAYQGQEAVDLARTALHKEEPFALAFVDMRMPPGWDGLQTIQNLWQVDPQLQVVICTAYSDHSWRDIQDELGRTDKLLMLKKPFDSAEVSQLAVALTEKWKLRSELESALNDALVASETKSAFVAAMSHELRTPLNGIIGMTQLLATTELTQRQRAYLEACRTSGESLLTVIGSILDFSKIEAGEFSLNLEPTNLVALVEGVVQSVGVQATEDRPKVELASFVGLDIPSSVLADSGKLRQLLFNLVGNAAKFTHVGNIHVTLNKVSQSNDSVVVKFSVKDSGVGIPSDQLDSIFEPFRQVDDSSTRKYGGTGLGLNISQQIVRFMGGKLQVQSTIDVGSEFEFELEFETVETSNQKNTIQAGAESELKIATSGFSRQTLSLIEKMLGNSNATCSPVYIQRTQDLIPDFSQTDCLLLDYGDNLLQLESVLNRIRTDKNHQSMRIIPVCSMGSELLESEYERLGLQPVLTKPICQSRVYQVLERLKNPKTDNLPSNIQPQIASRAIADLSGLRVLLVEDNKINQLYAQGLFDQLGIAHETCCDGKQAIETLLQDDDFDLIFMDYQMPLMDGLETASEIRNLITSGQIRDLPVAGVSAHAAADVKERCLASGMSYYLTKPFTIEEIIELIGKCKNIPVGKPTTRVESSIASNDHPVDFDELIERCCGNEKIASQLFKTFCEQLHDYCEKFPVAFDCSDLQLVQSYSHRLKGAASTIAAKQIAMCTAELDDAAKDQDLKKAEQIYISLEHEIGRVLSWIEQSDHRFANFAMLAE